MIPANGAKSEVYVEKITGNPNHLVLTRIILLLLIVISAASSCGDSQNKLSPLSPDATILAFGDSLTYGTGVNNGQNYPSQLAKLTTLKVINEGIPGELSINGLARLPALLDKHNPDLLILIHGGNDILRKHSRIELKQNILKMILISQQHDVEVILLGVPEPGIFLKSAAVYKEISEETSTVAELTLLAVILGDHALKSDISHPNAKGYLTLAEGIAIFLKKHGALTE